MGISGGVAEGDGIVVQITAAIAGLLSGMKESAEAVEAGTAEMGAAFESLGSILSVALAPMIALTAAMKGLSEIREAIDSTTEFGVQLEIMHQKTGMSVESLSALKYVAELNEVSFDRFGMALQRLARNMESALKSPTSSQAGAFKDLGIAAGDAEGHLRPMESVLLDVADKFHGMEDGAKKTALAMDLFGRTGADLIPMLNLGRDGIQRLEEEAQRLGVVLTAQNVEAITQYDDSLKKLHAAWGGFVLALATSVMPVLDGVARFLTAIVDVLRALGNGLRAIVNFLLLDWRQAWESGKDAVERLKDAWTAMSTTGEAPEEHKGPGEDVPTTAPDQVSALQKAEQELREWHEEHTRTQYDASEHDIIFWKKMLDSTEEGSKDYIAFYQKWADATQKVQNTIDQANEARARRLEKNAQSKGDLTGELKMAQDAAAQAKATFGNISKQYEDALAKVDAVREKMAQGWVGTFDTIHKAFTDTISKLRQTGGTFRDFMRGLFQNIADSFLQSQLRIVEAHAAAWLAQKGITTQGVEQTVAMHAWAALQTIASYAATAAAGAWAAISGIPYVGPFLAPAAAAAALAGVLALASTIHSAAGGFDIPAGVNPLTQLHEQEMVLPKQYANVIRGLANGGGGGGGRGDVHLHVHSMDAGGVKQFMMKHKDSIAGAAHAAAANGLGFREQPGRRA